MIGLSAATLMVYLETSSTKAASGTQATAKKSGGKQ